MRRFTATLRTFRSCSDIGSKPTLKPLQYMSRSSFESLGLMYPRLGSHVSRYFGTRETISGDEPQFPGLVQVSRAFSEALIHIRSQRARNMDVEAHKWAVSAAKEIIEDLVRQFNNLHVNKDSPTRLPRFVFDPKPCLRLFPPRLPYVLEPYRRHVQEQLRKFVVVCGFGCHTGYVEGPGDSAGFFYLDIKIPIEPKSGASEADRKRLVNGSLWQKVLDSGFLDKK